MALSQKLRVDEISNLGVQLDFCSSRDEWLRDLLVETLGEHFHVTDEVHAQLTAVCFEDTVDIIGGYFVRMHASCDRCLADYAIERQTPLHIVLEPAQGTRSRQPEWYEKSEIDDDEVEGIQYGTFQDREIDLGRLVVDHIVLHQPMQMLCSSACLGLCSRCGENLNESDCGHTADNLAGRS